MYVDELMGDPPKDGVLVRGAQVLPAAKRALAILDGHNPMGT